MVDPADPSDLRQDAPLLDGWLRYRAADTAPFGTPGHKQRVNLVGPVVRDHRGAAGKLQCNGPYCSTPKKSIIDGVKGTTTGTYKKQCDKHHRSCLHGHTH